MPRTRWVDEERLIALKGDRVKVRGEGHAEAVPHTASSHQQGVDASRPKMNKLEMRYSQYLDVLKFTGDIKDWRFESVKLRLADHCVYIPDFLIVLHDGRCELHECKGFMRDDALVKLKVAADQFPWWQFKIIRRVKGEWNIKSVS